jgi:hypothetical protein
LDLDACYALLGIVGAAFFGQPLDHLLNPDVFERFDFNGDGELDFMQSFKSLKCVLYELSLK